MNRNKYKAKGIFFIVIEMREEEEEKALKKVTDFFSSRVVRQFLFFVYASNIFSKLFSGLVVYLKKSTKSDMKIPISNYLISCVCIIELFYSNISREPD
jgi:hypothetical protein